MTYEALVKRVEENGGVLTVRMAELRDAHEAGKLGKHVRKGIADRLAGMGIGHYPQELPDSQHLSVRLYKLGSAVADIIAAVLEVDENGEGDGVLRSAAGSDAAETLKQVRALVCHR